MPEVRNAWYVAGWSQEVPPGRPADVRVLNEPIVLWRDASGRILAFEDRCIHRLAPLSLGRREGDALRCMYHGFLYGRDGRVVEIPGQERSARNLRLRSYPAIERYGWTWVWMGEPGAADEGLIPSLIGMEHPDYVSFHGELEYAAAAHLVRDNLLDLSHVSFLHAHSFRLSEVWARERPNVTERARSVRSERWIRNEGRLGMLESGEPQVDTYFCFEMFVPGVALFALWTFPPGTADATNGGPPDLSRPADGFATQAVTPLTDRTARYLYINGDVRRGKETSYDEAKRAVTEQAFSEDKAMIEAQQRNIDSTPDWRFLSTGADRGVTIFNRLLERAAREETACPTVRQER